MTAEVGKKCIAVPSSSGGYTYTDGYVPEIGEKVLAYPLPEGGYFVMQAPSLEVGDTISISENLIPFSTPKIIEWDDITQYYLSSIVSSSNVPNPTNCLGDTPSTYSYIYPGGYIEAAFEYNLEDSSRVVLTEKTFGNTNIALDPNDYIYPNAYSWAIETFERADVSFIYPNILRVECTSGLIGGDPFDLVMAKIYAFKIIS